MTKLNRTPMARRKFLHLGTIGVGMLAMGPAPRSQASEAASTPDSSKHPNIVVILADDLGYGDVGCYGADKVTTPNIDRIAKEGMLFTDAHSSAAVCTPARYSLLTGRYYWRRKKGWNRERLLIEPHETTVASLLKAAGYATGCVGKWHLGFGNGRIDWNGELKPGPLEVGFDYYFGTPMSHNEPPMVYVENRHVVGADKADPITVTEPGEGAFWGVTKGGEAARFKEEELATRQTEKAVSFIERSKENPFFLYFATNNVHVPLTPNTRFKGTSDIGVYGDYIHELDWAVGQLLDTLDTLGLTENTLVVFTSDNGAVHFDHVVEHGHMANGDLLGQKTDAWEGGHRVPFIARWPGKVKPNSRSDELVCLNDVLATAAAIVQKDLPPNAGPDSFNILPVLLSEPHDSPLRPNLVMLGIHGMAVREGPWLLIPKQGSCGVTTEATEPWWIKMEDLGITHSDYTEAGTLKADAAPGQLYNLADDPGERVNLYSKHPEIVSRLGALMDKLKKDGRSRD